MARFVYKKQYIGQLELLGAVCVFVSWPQLFAGRSVIHFIDNISALCALLKGYSSLPDSARIVYAYHCIVFFLNSKIWDEFVCSDANVGDMPTRLSKPEFRTYLVDTLRATEIPLIMPEIDMWDQPFSDWQRFSPRSPAGMPNVISGGVEGESRALASLCAFSSVGRGC